MQNLPCVTVNITCCVNFTAARYFNSYFCCPINLHNLASLVKCLRGSAVIFIKNPKKEAKIFVSWSPKSSGPFVSHAAAAKTEALRNVGTRRKSNNSERSQIKHMKHAFLMIAIRKHFKGNLLVKENSKVGKVKSNNKQSNSPWKNVTNARKLNHDKNNCIFHEMRINSKQSYQQYVSLTISNSP